MPSSDKAIEIQKLNLQLGQRIILDSISFEVNSGTILGILGRSGSGKTSLFRAILGVPTTTNLEQSGSIYFSERPDKKFRSIIYNQSFKILSEVSTLPGLWKKL